MSSLDRGGISFGGACLISHISLNFQSIFQGKGKIEIFQSLKVMTSLSGEWLVGATIEEVPLGLPASMRASVGGVGGGGGDWGHLSHQPPQLFIDAG